MSACPQDSPGPFWCPTADAIGRGILKLWPTGRAWPASRDPSLWDRFLAWLPSASPALLPSQWPAGFVQAGYSKTVSDVYGYAVARWCALREEFWCATQVETHDLWMQEYGLPDACDPFPDLCTKVAAIGGARCEYFQAVAARMGWSIACIDQAVACGSRMGCSHMGNTGDVMGAGSGVRLDLIVNLHESAAYAGGFQTPPLMGRLQMGQPIACPPDISPLECLIDRIAPAHVVVSYTTTN